MHEEQHSGSHAHVHIHAGEPAHVHTVHTGAPVHAHAPTRIHSGQLRGICLKWEA